MAYWVVSCKVIMADRGVKEGKNMAALAPLNGKMFLARRIFSSMVFY
jgi:hypothetical protein